MAIKNSKTKAKDNIDPKVPALGLCGSGAE